MNRLVHASRRAAPLRTLVRLGCLGVMASALASWLTACQSAVESPGCSSAADCASGQQCVNSQCTPASGGSAGATQSGGNGASGYNSSAGSGAFNTIGGAAGSASGGQSFAGSSAAGSSTGGSAGQTAAAGQGGTANTGNAGSGGSGGSVSHGGSTSAGGSAGTGGMSYGGDVVGKCKDDYLPAANPGSVTRYDFAMGTSLPACAYVITHKGAGKDGDWDTVEGISTGDGGYFGAMNTTDYNKGAVCGACAEITYNGGKKVVITIVDECPVSSNSKCVKGHIDLSRKAIRQLESQSNVEYLGRGGTGSISWRYVTCPAAGNAKIRLHPKQSEFWQPVVIENGLYPLTEVTVNGVKAVRVGNGAGNSTGAGNAWLAQGEMLPYVVRATDLNGNSIEVPFTGGSTLTDVGKQFMCTK